MKLEELHTFGQSLWLDYIRRDILTTGEFARLVRDDGVRGVTTNPSIFDKAIADSTEYDVAIAHYGPDAGTPGARADTAKTNGAAALYESLAMQDIRAAASVLRPVYDATSRRDGFISMEVSPKLAHDTQGTLAEARRLWREVDRENLMIKVPATTEGIAAIAQLIGEGINVNATLLFSRAACQHVAAAYMTGLEALAARGGAVDRVASVASMFVSRIDVKVDALLEARPGAAHRALLGKVAVANAKLAYQDWKELCASARWQALAAKGARPQRLLWASTSVKDKRLRDTYYVEELIGPDTVDTIPPETLDAMRDHGKAENRLEAAVDEAHQVMAALARAGIVLDEVTQELLDEGVAAFSKSFDALLASLDQKRAALRGPPAKPSYGGRAAQAKA